MATVVRRHKTLGAYVPVWGPGPCRNPECKAYVEDADEASRDRPGEAAARSTTGRPPEEAAK
ncbi:hypothetical protein GCM10023083_07520 [Streptomyces phyllanthi]